MRNLADEYIEAFDKWFAANPDKAADYDPIKYREDFLKLSRKHQISALRSIQSSIIIHEVALT
jgi:hypothetical protein